MTWEELDEAEGDMSGGGFGALGRVGKGGLEGGWGEGEVVKGRLEMRGAFCGERWTFL